MENRNVIVTKIARAQTETIRRLGELGVATLHEAQGRIGLMKPYMRPIYAGARMAGSAVTVVCRPGDNLMIHAAISVVLPGDVLVVSTTSESTDGMFGDLLGESCKAHGVVGLIIDAGVRDTADLANMRFPVWSKAVSAQGTIKSSAGSVNVTTICAGAVIHPGDVVVADDDGVVVIPRQCAEEVLELGEKRRDKEQTSRERLRAGELGIEMYGLKKLLVDLGVEWVESAE